MSGRRSAPALLPALGAVLATIAAPAAPAQVPIGDFYYFERSDAGGVRRSITTIADENRVAGAGGLTWACEGGELTLTLSTTYLGRGFRARTRWTFDGGEPSDTQAWILMTSGMAVRAPDDVVEPFTRAALAAGDVVLQVTDYQFRRYSYSYGLAGLGEALARLPCWPPGSAGSQASRSRPTVLSARQTQVSAAP